MPLSDDEWEKAHNKPVKRVVLEFLKNNPDYGYNRLEIAEGINIKLSPETKRDAEHPTRSLAGSLFRLYRVKRACDTLTKEGKVSRKFAESDGGRTIYYRYDP
jgi:hypothetical protein